MSSPPTNTPVGRKRPGALPFFGRKIERAQVEALKNLRMNALRPGGQKSLEVLRGAGRFLRKLMPCLIAAGQSGSDTG